MLRVDEIYFKKLVLVKRSGQVVLIAMYSSIIK